MKEVWFWYQDGFRLFVLGVGGYAEVKQSVLVPALDFEVLASFAEEANQHEALKRYRDHLRRSSP